jgi:2-keto-4-pentenoate hydratase
MVRWSITNGGNGYYVLAHSNSYGLYINRTVNGANTVIASDNSYSSVEKGILGFEIIGNRLKVYHNQRKILDVTDTVHANAGYAGVAARAASINYFRGMRL